MHESPDGIAQPRRRRKISATSRAVRALPAQSVLLEWLRYEPDTGRLYRTAKRKGGPNACNERIPLSPHQEIGRLSSHGYLVVKLFGMSNLQVSRIVWIMQTGADPRNSFIDHVNGNKADNRWENLRLATCAQNIWNKPKPSRPNGDKPRSQFKGVTAYRCKDGKSWIYWARIMAHGKRVSLGFYPTQEAAYAAYCEAAKKYHGEFARVE